MRTFITISGSIVYSPCFSCISSPLLANFFKLPKFCHFSCVSTHGSKTFRWRKKHFWEKLYEDLFNKSGSITYSPTLFSCIFFHSPTNFYELPEICHFTYVLAHEIDAFETLYKKFKTYVRISVMSWGSIAYSPNVFSQIVLQIRVFFSYFYINEPIFTNYLNFAFFRV